MNLFLNHEDQNQELNTVKKYHVFSQSVFSALLVIRINHLKEPKPQKQIQMHFKSIKSFTIIKIVPLVTRIKLSQEIFIE